MATKTYKPRKTVYETIYTRLEALGILSLITENKDSAKSKGGGYIDLCFDFLYVEDEGTTRISLAHYFKQNGDLCADPDMEIRIHTNGTAEALTFQQAIPPIYQEVYPGPGKYYPKLKKDLNNFLAMWLKNCLSQGHKFTV